MGTFKPFDFRKLGDIPKNEQVIISSGNVKIGNVWNTSFPRVVTCNPEAPCTKKGCYMASREGMRPNVRRAYTQNLRIYNDDPINYWAQMNTFLYVRKPQYFRYFVDGDIPSVPYLFEIVRHADRHQGTIFTVYTKRYNFLTDWSTVQLPKNLILLASAWPNFAMPKVVQKNFRVVWMDDGKEDRIPADAIQCPAKCSECMVCYHPNETRDVSIKRHR